MAATKGSFVNVDEKEYSAQESGFHTSQNSLFDSREKVPNSDGGVITATCKLVVGWRKTRNHKTMPAKHSLQSTSSQPKIMT